MGIYVYTPRLLPGTTARAGDVSTQFDAIQTAFDSLPAGSTVVNNMYFDGNHDASGGDPATPVGVNPVYRISVAGTITGAGAVLVGDDIYWNDSTWNRVINTIDAGAVGFSELDTDLFDAQQLIEGNSLDISAVTVTSDGSIITCSVEKSGGGNIRVVFSDGVTIWVTAPDTIALTAGSDASPQSNYVYFLKSTLALTVSTSAFPLAEHFPVANVLCQSAVSLQNDGAYKVHVWTDHVTGGSLGGHLTHLNHWIRHQSATWQSGVALTPAITINGGAEDNVDISTAAGEVLQLHDHAFPAFDTSVSSDVYVVNHNTASFTKITDLNDADEDDAGNAIGNNDWTNLVIWGVVSEASGDCKLMLNLPSDFHGSALAATTDAEKFSNYTIPVDFRNSGFLIARLTFKFTSAGSGTWTLTENLDLRNSGAVGGSGVGGVEFADNVFRILDNADPTKEIAFQASSISTATTRTITMPDADVDLSSVGGVAFADNTFRIQDDGDPSKEIAFQASGISGSTTRTITVPDADVNLGSLGTGNLADDAVTYAKIQNVVADERLLGRVSGANGVIEELTQAQIFTFLGTSADGLVDWKAGTEAGFHSVGIDDNATAERVALSDTEIVIGPSDTSEYRIERVLNTGILSIAGGTGANPGGNIVLYGESHASQAGDIEFRTGGGVRLHYDDSQTRWEFSLDVQILLDQGTSNTGFIDYRATADADVNSAISTFTTSGAIQGHIQIEINGTKRWLAFLADPS